MTRAADAHPAPPTVHVVAGVLTDARGRVLLARRGDGRDLSGLWEFPGGKVEPGETPEAALARELREEIGVGIEGLEPLIAVPHAYPHKRILLDVYRVRRVVGRARGLEDQALAWVPRERLPAYAMPAADRPVVAALLQPAGYLVTPSDIATMPDAPARVARALRAGVQRVQLRTAGLTSAQVHDLATAIADTVAAAGAELLLNGMLAGTIETTAALAAELGCGLHLTEAQLMALDARPDCAGPFAASCHGLAALLQAQALGADFAVLGPVLPTATHPHASPLGWDAFAALRAQVALPIYAIGGLGREALLQARAHGAQGIAAIRGLWSTD